MTNSQANVIRGYLANADKVRVRGVEVDFSLRPIDGLEPVCQRRVHRSRVHELLRCALPARARRAAPAASAANPPSAPGTPGGFSPAVLRHLGSVAAGHLARSPSRTALEYDLPIAAARPRGRRVLRLRRQLSLEVLVQPVALDLHRRRRLLARELPRRLPHDGLERLRLGAQRVRRGVLRVPRDAVGQHRPGRRPARRSAHLWPDGEQVVLRSPLAKSVPEVYSRARCVYEYGRWETSGVTS